MTKQDTLYFNPSWTLMYVCMNDVRKISQPNAVEAQIYFQFITFLYVRDASVSE